MFLKSKIKKIVPKKIICFYHDIVFTINLNKKRSLYKKTIYDTYHHYDTVKEKIKNREDKKIHFASYVVFDSTFSAYGIMDILLKNPEKYAPKIVIIPDVSRGQEHLIKQYNQTKSFFIKKYGKEYVIDGYNEITNEFIDVSNQFDIVYCANPYDAMVNKVHGVSYLTTKDILPIYISYGCMPDKYSAKILMPMLEISLFWKVYADNEYSFKDYKKYELAKGKNVLLSGYSKMDSLNDISSKEKSKIKIILAPHHTINYPALPLSNFLKYYDFILTLPERFPNIEFIFRPHPLLFTNLINDNFWTKDDVENYITKIQNKGMLYSTGGDYLEIFYDSDAIIHDCSSFIVEYLYTGKPSCFVAKKNYKEMFGKLGKACLKNYYIAFNENEIISFINDVIINKKDKLKTKREIFTKEKLALNYPNVSDIIVNSISDIK